MHQHKSKWKRSWWQHNTQAYTIFMATALPLESIGIGAVVASGVQYGVQYDVCSMMRGVYARAMRGVFMSAHVAQGKSSVCRCECT